MDLYMSTFILLYCLILGTFAQTENADRLESCNVVCNCNSGQSTETDSSTRRLTAQGPPGKLGPKGDVGPVGSKGEKGATGSKGEKGRAVDETFANHILQAMSTSSCQELKTTQGISMTGYYLMMNKVTKAPEYRYCDFTSYPDVTSCLQLQSRRNITRKGSYIFGRNADSNMFQYCSFSLTGIRTCQALRNVYTDIGATDSGFYNLESSDGEPMRVYCRFSQNEAISEVNSNMMTEVEITNSCDGRGCHIGTPQYSISDVGLTDILQNSVSCKQFVKLRCQNIRFRGEDFSWWISQNAEKMLYWGGTTRDNYCACGETNSCANTNQKCNCDENAATIRTDEGYLTDKTKLPLREIRVGDLDSSDEHAWYTIGKLECVGQV